MRGVRDFKLCKEDISNRVSSPDCIQVRGTLKCFNLVLERNDKTAPWDRLYLEFENPMNYHYDDGTIKTKPHITTDDLSGVLSEVRLICEKFIKGEIRESSIGWPRYDPLSILEEVQGFIRTPSFEPRSPDWDAQFDDADNIIIQSLIDDKKEYVYNKKTDSEGNIFYSSNEKYYSPNGTEVDENGKIISGGSKDVILGNEEKQNNPIQSQHNQFHT